MKASPSIAPTSPKRVIATCVPSSSTNSTHGKKVSYEPHANIRPARIAPSNQAGSEAIHEVRSSVPARVRPLRSKHRDDGLRRFPAAKRGGTPHRSLCPPGWKVVTNRLWSEETALPDAERGGGPEKTPAPNAQPHADHAAGKQV